MEKMDYNLYQDIYNTNERKFQLKCDELLEPLKSTKRARPKLNEYNYTELLDLYNSTLETSDTPDEKVKDDLSEKKSSSNNFKIELDTETSLSNNFTITEGSDNNTINIDHSNNDTRLTSCSDLLNTTYEAIDETIDNYESNDDASTNEFLLYNNSLNNEASNLDNSLNKDILSSGKETTSLTSNDNNIYVISEELRQSYIKQSKLLPKIRGVWFNSTVRRMGWVGQAYKKCKRIEKIFSVNKHGFEGARRLAIAFRNSQKPMNKTNVLANYPDITLNDIIKPISQLKYKLYNDVPATQDTQVETKEETATFPIEKEKEPELESDSLSSFNYNTLSNTTSSKDTLTNLDIFSKELNYDDYMYDVNYRDVVANYKSELTKDEKKARDNFCKEALLFMLYELEALIEMDFPVPPISKLDCKQGISFHINLIENSKSNSEILPYINYLAYYICNGMTPTDIPHTELYPLIKILSYCSPLKF